MSGMIESSGPSSFPAGPRVESLGIHPVKSARGLSPRRWYFDARGPILDRHWMIVDASRRFLSLREVPDLARLVVSLRGIDEPRSRQSCTLDLEFDGHRIEVFASDDAPSAATLWGSDRLVIDQGDKVAKWLSERLEREVRLVRHDPEHDPWTQSDPPADNAATGLSDGYPVLILCRSTLAKTLGSEWSPRRFRPNVLVGDTDDGVEDGWRRIRIGDVELELVKPCVRCIATTVDPDRGVRNDAEPLRMLKARRTWDGKPTMGWNALVRTAGRIEVGDTVEVIETRTSDIEFSPNA